LLKAAALHAPFIILADGRDAAVERVLLDLDEMHGDAGVREAHADAAAHRARAEDADLLDHPRGRLLRDVRDLRGLALGEKVVALRLGLRAVHQPQEALALVRQAFFEWLLDRRLHAVDDRQWRLEAAALLLKSLLVRAEQLGLTAVGRDLVFTVAHLSQRLALRDGIAGKRDRVVEQRVLAHD